MIQGREHTETLFSGQTFKGSEVISLEEVRVQPILSMEGVEFEQSSLLS